MIDLAVPRDIDPGCREIDGVSLHDVDDVQALVERNASGREAEAVGARRIIDAEIATFERWLASQEVVPTVSALRERADAIVEQVLAENANRWESLSEADRERLRLLAQGDRRPPAARADAADQGRRRPRRRLHLRRPRCASSSASTPAPSRPQDEGAEVTSLDEARRDRDR